MSAAVVAWSWVCETFQTKRPTKLLGVQCREKKIYQHKIGTYMHVHEPLPLLVLPVRPVQYSRTGR